MLHVAAASTGQVVTAEQQPAPKLAAAPPELAALIESWDFNAFDFSDQQCVQLAVSILVRAGAPDILMAPEDRIAKFVTAVAKMYNANLFHNFSHAVMVMQACHVLLAQGVGTLCDEVDKVALLVAALCHDVDHRGLSNSFLTNSKHELAQQYGTDSVMERHHAACTESLVHDREGGLLINLSEEKRAHFLKLVCDVILATDMAVHGAQLAQLKEVNTQGGFTREDDAERRTFMLKVALHTADLYNPVKPFNVSRQWAGQLQREFNAQVALEKALGLPSLPFMEGQGELALAKGEIGFLKFVAVPWYEQVATAFPQFKTLLDAIRKRAASIVMVLLAPSHSGFGTESNMAKWAEVVEQNTVPAASS